MRHKKVKNLDSRMAAVQDYLVTDIGGSALKVKETAARYKGKWRKYFASLQETAEPAASIGQATSAGLTAPAGLSNPVESEIQHSTPIADTDSRRLYLELGCGKGKFINARALADPDAYFVGIEGLDAVLVRGLERAKEARIANLRFVSAYVADIRDFFADGELDGIYLNFSDPWPKPRHEKRRFTYGDTLLKYRQILKPGGFVAFKTDNEDLFTFTLEEIERLGLTIEEMSRDLHSPDCTLAARRFTTEYEDKFSGKGKNINYVKIRF